MTEFHHGPYQHMSPSGFIGFVIALGLIIGFLLYLPPTERYALVATIIALGIVVAIFLHSYFGRRTRADRLSLLEETDLQFERVSNKIASNYEMSMKDHSRKSTCPFCKNEFRQMDKILLCSTCHAIHHLDCWNQNEGCAIFGCEGKKVDSSTI